MTHWTKEMLKENQLNLLENGDTVEAGITVLSIHQRELINVTHCEEIVVNKVSKYSSVIFVDCVYKFNKNVKSWKNFRVAITETSIQFYSLIERNQSIDVLLTKKQIKRILQRVKELSED